MLFGGSNLCRFEFESEIFRTNWRQFAMVLNSFVHCKNTFCEIGMIWRPLSEEGYSRLSLRSVMKSTFKNTHICTTIKYMQSADLDIRNDIGKSTCCTLLLLNVLCDVQCQLPGYVALPQHNWLWAQKTNKGFTFSIQRLPCLFIARYWLILIALVLTSIVYVSHCWMAIRMFYSFT